MTDNREQPAGGVETERLERDELGILMLCAWCNVPRELAPKEWSSHENVWTRDAWARVAKAVIAYGSRRPPADAGKADSGEALGTIRICPERDGPCPYGMKCPWTINQYYCRQPPIEAPTPPVPVSEDAVEAFDDRWIGDGDSEHVLPHMARGDQGAGAMRVKPLTEEEIVALIHKHFPWKSNPHAADALTYEKSPPMFPQATYDVPRFNTVDFIRAIEARSTLIAPSTDQVTALVEAARDLVKNCPSNRYDVRSQSAASWNYRSALDATRKALLPFAKAPAPDDTKGGA